MIATRQIARQTFLPFDVNVPTDKDSMASDVESRGAVFTRREVVEFILDLVGYTIDKPLQQYRLLEPSFGDGHFLLVAVERLLERYQHVRYHSATLDICSILDAVRAVEKHPGSFAYTRGRLLALLSQHGISQHDAEHVLSRWLIQGDFLLAEIPDGFTHVVGNPPYIRQELIPDRLLSEYRQRYATMYDRADIYVPFLERSLTALGPGGLLGFICSDRWMKNKYGGPLRKFVADHFHLVAYVDMVGTNAFQSDVSAYTAVTLIRRESGSATRIAHRPALAPVELSNLATALLAATPPKSSGVIEVSGVVNGSEPWILQSLDQLAVVRRLEREFPALEETGAKVGIGVATGADKIFIGDFASMDVEPSRKLPLVQTDDIADGTVRWRGRGVLNPFEANGSLASLTRYPRFARYVERHADVIRKRNCAGRTLQGWYRTIDRITPDLLRQPKLLIPDIKGEAHVVYECGEFYPHHNLYYITSTEWDLKALQVVLQSGIARLFVAVYSTQMRGGFLRFQAQYLRRIRLPNWQDVPADIRRALLDPAADRHSVRQQAVFDLYGLTRAERAAVGGNGNGRTT
jgi:hypothetical protein